MTGLEGTPAERRVMTVPPGVRHPPLVDENGRTELTCLTWWHYEVRYELDLAREEVGLASERILRWVEGVWVRGRRVVWAALRCRRTGSG